MSGCGGGCNCGSDCSCGSGCKCGSRSFGGLEMYPDVEKSTTFTIIQGVAPVTNYGRVEEKAGGEGGNGCKCGANCSCDPCNC